MKKILLSFYRRDLYRCKRNNCQKPNGPETLMLEQPVEITLDFAKDTLSAITNGDGQVLKQ